MMLPPHFPRSEFPGGNSDLPALLLPDLDESEFVELLGRVLVVALLVMGAGVGVSLVLSLSGSPETALLVAVAGFVLMTAVVVAYDLAYAHEVRRVR